ncbi:MAG TPA: cytochrome d ubiquinol oxidase subunit II [Candidatus Acidoferrales bacterium]|nr:cytochrome d ubiquinol oxidase subunit II [Candidatus Acidoferrales bacterium]
MGSIWFCLIAIMLAAYVVLDGFDLGVGVLHLWIARSDAERRLVLRSIGPVWDGNEVWLIAAGGTLYFAFPLLYAASFSGFYLPLMIILWLLIIRGASVEFRSHVGGPIWSVFWDAGFALASTLLAIFYGAALGNVVRGVPLDAHGRFFEPLWTNFLPFGRTGILDWYTVLVGLVVLTALTVHGATWLAYKTRGELSARTLRVASQLWWLVMLLTIAVTFASFRLLPQLLVGFRVHPWGFLFPVAAVAGLLGIQWFAHAKAEGMAFGASCLYLVGMLTSVAFSLYPSVLPSSTNPLLGLTVSNAKAADYGLKIGLIWWVIGMVLAGGYTAFTYRNFTGKIQFTESQEHEGY